MKISKVTGLEVLDSRGNPTVEATVHAGKYSAYAIVPSGASTGIHEANEKRDKGKRFLGKGVQRAVRNLDIISKKLKGIEPENQRLVDSTMINLDGTKNKSRLGANAILAVSMANSRLAAKLESQPLYKHIATLYGNRKPVLPVPFSNIINGGVHAGNKLEMQEFMIAPIKAQSFSKATQMVSETYHILKDIIRKKHGKNSTNVGDEGGFAPPLAKAEDALNLIEDALSESGYKSKIRPAMDPAASEFFVNGKYKLYKDFSREKLAEYYLQLAKDYKIISLEDPFEQDDFEGFKGITKKARFQIVGDDLTVSNPERIKIAAEQKLCNALLLKVNQIGTITEAMQSAKLAMNNNWKVMVSHRSGETEDSFISDLAAGIGCGQAKIGAPARSDRTAKYNRLLRLEKDVKRYARW